jgi:hypothetical protein
MGRGAPVLCRPVRRGEERETEGWCMTGGTDDIEMRYRGRMSAVKLDIEERILMTRTDRGWI